MVFKLLIVIMIILLPIRNDYEVNGIKYNLVDNEINNIFMMDEEIKNKLVSVFKTTQVIKTYHGPMTAYGPDCRGCSGITASGYNVLHNIYYNDKTYGKIRILAADKMLPFGTIIRISGLEMYPDDLLGIVLDRGSAIGFTKRSYIDLLYTSERETANFGCQQATFEVLRLGY